MVPRPLQKLGGNSPLCPQYIYIYIYMGWVQVTSSVTLSNITPPNNLLFDSYFENSTVELHVLYVLNMHANFMSIRCNLPFDT